MDIKIATIGERGTTWQDVTLDEDEDEDEETMLTEDEAYEMYDEMLDQCYEPYNMSGMIYMPSDILKECDPIAYRVGFSDYVDTLAQDGTPVEGWV
jgi:hypothetical protein